MTTSSRQHESLKHQIIKRSNTVIFVSISVTVFILIFSILSAFALFDQASYNQKIIGEKKDALKLVEKNVTNIAELESSYRSFVEMPINILSGNPDGEGPIDGKNPKLVLDALPSEYDFPALTVAVDKLLLDSGFSAERIGGSEDVSYATDDEGSLNPKLIEVPYPISTTTTASGAQKLLETLEKSLRLFYVDRLELSGNDDSMSVTLSTRTFYQPTKAFIVSSKVVRE